MVVTTPHSILSWTPESAADLEHFCSVPWLGELIALPGVRPYKTDSPVRPPGSKGEGNKDGGADPVLDGFMARPDGVRRHVTLLAQSGALPEALERGIMMEGRTRGGDGQKQGEGQGDRRRGLEEEKEAKSPNPFPTHLDILTLGPSLHGIPHTLHGGVLTLVLDAVCGRAGFMHRDPARQVYTAYTNVAFARPVIAGAADHDDEDAVTVLVRTRVCEAETRDGRMVIRASVEGEDGLVYARAESAVVEKAWKGRL
ncbi:hypothetical protein F5B20DRAFT_125202 [Whalleya microplaca]|nr:hypothetical protein F5B20DRAFT_125202 [Whalleya microplaca]